MTKRQLSLSNLINSSYSTYLILGLIWLLSNLCDRLWLSLNQSVPAWDQSNHLTNSLFYLRALQNPDLFNGEWWRQLWMLSPKYPPVTYLFGAFFQGIFGTGNDPALLTSFLYSGVLLICVYLLGKVLFNREVGLWAAGITVLLPRLYQNRLQFLLDNPLLALVIACFTCLTFWKLEQNPRRQWLQMGLFSLCFGLALLTKQSILFYLFFPLLFLTINFLWQRQWLRILQLILGVLGSTLICYPWYRTNWIYLFSTAQNSNAIPAAMEGDPAVNTLAAWVYYAKDLPLAVSWVLLIIPMVGFLLHLLGRFPREKESLPVPKVTLGLLWLGIFFGGTYLICSALYNKDSRYIIPYLPILAIFLAYGLTRWRSRWYGLQWATISLAIIVTLTNLYPIPFSDQFSQALSPEVLFRPKFERVPNQEVFETAIAATPYQVVNIGVIPNTAQINPNTLNYFGTLANYQGSGRELATNSEKVKEDSQNFQWFLRKTGENGFAQAPQLAFADKLPNDSQFKPIKTWSLTDNSQLELYRQKNPFVTIKPTEFNTDKLQLQKITVPEKAPAGFPLGISYQWLGNQSLFADGLVLLTWRSQDNPQAFWIHDHGLGLGEFFVSKNNPDQGLKLIENTATFPPANLPQGAYQLEAIYLNKKTGETEKITVPPTQIILDNTAKPLPAHPLDYVTQLRELALNLPQGRTGLDPIFQQIDRINLYDAHQDYLQQADASLSYRLNHQSPDPIPLTYALVLARVLQQNPQTAIAALQSLVKLDANNPYSHAYLAFVYLYDWQGKNAEMALEPALKLAPDKPELKLLKAIALIMQGNLWGGWQIIQPLLGTKI